MKKTVELSDGRAVRVNNRGDNWKIKIIGKDGKTEDVYEENTARTIDSDEQVVANVLTRMKGAAVGPKFPKGGQWLISHDITEKDALKVAEIVANIVYSGISNLFKK